MQEVQPDMRMLTDLGNAERLIDAHGERLRYTGERGWFRWVDTHWSRVPEDHLIELAKRSIRGMYREAAEIDEDDSDRRAKLGKWASWSEHRGRVEAMIRLARADPRVVVGLDDFDTGPDLLAAQNGIVDLRTGKLTPHTRCSLITSCLGTRFDAQAKAPTWALVLSRVTGGDRDLAHYLARAVGYSLTGHTTEQCLFFCHGDGQNGKSTFLNVLRGLMGGYARQADPQTFLAQRDQRARPDIARLCGARMVLTAEIGKGERFDEVMLKQLTGGDTIVARYLYREEFEFVPRFKLWIAANNKPTIHGADHAIWRRIRLLPFTARVPTDEKDTIGPRLRAELPGILAWAVRGCLAWRAEGLEPPASVRAATQSYRSEMGSVRAFIADCLVEDLGAELLGTAVYARYESWCRTGSRIAETKTTLGRQLAEAGYHKRRSQRGSMWRGLKLRRS